MSSSVIEKAVKTAVRIDGNSEYNQHRLQTLEKQLAIVNQRKEDLFGFEDEADAVFATKAVKLKREKNQLKRSATFGHLPCLDLSALSWRNRQGWPKIALFGLDSPKVGFSVLGRYSDGEYDSRLYYVPVVEPVLPRILKQCYNDVFEKLKVMAKRERKSVHLVAACRGVIPQDTRKKIQEAQQLFQEVYVAAEAEEWQLGFQDVPKPKPRNPDPLVLGWDGSNLWIIDQFNLTTAERYLRAEFAT